MRRTSQGSVPVRSHYRNINHRIRNTSSMPPLEVVREPRLHADTNKLLSMLNTAFPQYSLLIEAGRVYLNNRTDINGIISIALKDIPIEDKISYTLDKLYEHRGIIIRGITNRIFSLLCNTPSLKFLNNNAFTQILNSEMSDVIGSFFEG